MCLLNSRNRLLAMGSAAGLAIGVLVARHRVTGRHNEGIAKMTNIKYLAALFAVVLAVGELSSAKHNPKAHKTGYLILKQEASIGRTILAPGEYKVSHRHSVNGHYVEFARWKGPTPTWGTSPHDYDVVARIYCEMKPTEAMVTETTLLSSNDSSFASLEIRGAKVVYVFPLGSEASMSQNPPRPQSEAAQ